MKLIVPVLNRYDLLNRMIASIDHEIEALLVIDNGAGLHSESVGPECSNPNVKDFQVLAMPNNLGISSSWNLGVKAYPFESIYYFTSNDCVFQPGTLQKLEQVSKTDRMTIAQLWPHFQLFSVGECVFENCGLFDEAIFPMNFEDDEFAWRMNEMGYQIQMADLPMQHDGQMTFKSNQHYANRNAMTYKANERYYNDKVAERKLNAGEWSLRIRRANHW